MSVDRRMPRAAAQRPRLPSSPYDAGAALEHLLARLRASAGATRVSVWVYEKTTEMVVPFRHVAAESAGAAGDDPRPSRPIMLGRSPFFSAVVRKQQAVVARADGRRAADREMAESGLRSAHGEPLMIDGEIVGVLTIEPAAAAAPHLLRQAGPKLATATAEAWARRSDERRLFQAEVLLGLIESAGAARSMDQLLSSACRQLAELGEVQRACIFLLEDGRLVSVGGTAGDVGGGRGLATRRRLRAAPVALQLAEKVVQTGGPLAADKASGLLSGWWADDVEIASALAVPLGRVPNVSGVLTLLSTEVRPFPEDVRRLAAAAGAHLGGVIGQARTSQERSASLTGLAHRRSFIAVTG